MRTPTGKSCRFVRACVRDSINWAIAPPTPESCCSCCSAFLSLVFAFLPFGCWCLFAKLGVCILGFCKSWLLAAAPRFRYWFLHLCMLICGFCKSWRLQKLALAKVGVCERLRKLACMFLVCACLPCFAFVLLQNNVVCLLFFQKLFFAKSWLGEGYCEICSERFCECL